MADNYTPPEASLEMVSENNSGQGKVDNLPEGIKGFSWGAFLLSWIWAIGNSTWIGLLALVPYVGFIVSIYLGFKGREMAWQNKRWDSVEHFQRVQKQWSFWGVLIIGGIFLLGILSAILIPAIQANA
ncbi:hypothetical protein NQS96_09950 [Pseudoalteromonas shioyasakiensis]|uniref:hypothetical protein n=1 Tax=Pseudoalteromonas TaxID=53246 RepID=UPI000C912E4F|nr:MULTISPECIES: hypothetical protein [Pseudoalteromonas]MAD03342.1 hypothetical protein [Pseudoalteromonas sp.]MCG9708916.1 hypothetical protein [Pseudoalteromonas sp. Isolate3]MCP4588584.1 hypothetical protein [Pseudoalteromonas sp.]MCQ8882109.1 hypothetical protein [Pseudoalteromonas shioyasakiensis]NIZ05403.1 hypothetical protein [Pseudoalteromonas sp. HF66]|tara:strand:- start:3429 stop:3812 length:384 start_codon:yes stop_codon:yes gene_type:complete